MGWVKPHYRNGSYVSGYFRNTTNRSSTNYTRTGTSSSDIGLLAGLITLAIFCATVVLSGIWMIIQIFYHFGVSAFRFGIWAFDKSIKKLRMHWWLMSDFAKMLTIVVLVSFFVPICIKFVFFSN